MFSYRYVAQHGGVKGHKFGLSAVMPAGEGLVKAAVAYMRGHDESVKTGDDTVEIRSIAGTSVRRTNTP